MLLSWVLVLFWLQGAPFFTPPIWFAALRVLCMRWRAMPSLVAGSSAWRPVKEKLLAFLISHCLGHHGRKVCGVQASSDPLSVVLLMEGRSSSRSDACKGRRCMEKLCRNDMVSGRNRPRQFINKESLFYGNMHTRNRKNQWANLIRFNQKTKYIPMTELLSAIKPTQHLILPHT